MKKNLLLLILSSALCLPSPATAQIIAAGANHSLVVCNDGSVQSWGLNSGGQLGNGTTTSSSVPVLVSALTGVVAVAGGGVHSLAVKNDGTVWSWGNNGWGQLGINGTLPYSWTPLQVAPFAILTGITAVDAGEYHSFSLKNDGTVNSWGHGIYGQLGNGTISVWPVPHYVFCIGVTAVAGGNAHSLLLRNDGTVWSSGSNSNGQLADGITAVGLQSDTPRAVVALTGMTAVATGYDFSLALKNNGTVWAWGKNNYGQLGDSTTTDRSTPVQVSMLTGIIDVEGGAYHSLALKNDETVWAWGYNNAGQLGNGTSTNSNVPVQVSTLTGIIAIAGGGFHSLALKNDGTVWAWGQNTNGQLGNGTNTDSNVPVQVTGLCPVLTGLNEENIISALNIFPNPASTSFTIYPEYSGRFTISEIEIYNTLGEKVFIQQQTTNNKPQTVDVSQLLPGVYFVAVTKDKGNKITRKFVKM